MARPPLIPARGAVAEPLLMEVERALGPGDLPRLAEAPAVSVPILQKLRPIHHRQAQLLAEGRQLREVAAIVGCTPQRLTQLLIDPTFTELVGYYRDQTMRIALEDGARLRDKIVEVGELAVDELRERFDDEAKRARLPIGEVRKVAEFAMDRTVAPPKQAATPVTPPAAITISFGTPVGPRPAPTVEGKLSPQGET